MADQGADQGAAAAVPKASLQRSRSGSGHERHAVDERVLEPYRYLMAVPGKDVRGRLIDAFQVWLNIPQEAVDGIKPVLPRWPPYSAVQHWAESLRNAAAAWCRLVQQQ